MKVVKFNSYNEMSIFASRLFLTQLRIKKFPIIALPTGSTPLGMYKELIRNYEDGKISFNTMITFNLDEYYPINNDDPQSYHHFMENNFFKYIDVDKKRLHIPNGECSDPIQEAKDYEAKIKQYRGIDLAVLGIGENGHIGFNEPGKLIDETHLTDLSTSTIKANSRFFNNYNDIPRQAITMGMKTISNAQKIIILAAGSRKMPIVDKIIKGELDENCPATMLCNHPNITLLYTPYEIC